MRDHFETFRTSAARLRDGNGLPRFVEAEFRVQGGTGLIGRGSGARPGRLGVPPEDATNRRTARVTRGGAASTCAPAWWCQPGGGNGSSAYAAMRYGRR